MISARTTLRRCALSVAVAAAAGLASPAFAQLGAVRGVLGGGVGQLLRTPGDLTSQTVSALDPLSLLSLRTDRLDALVRAHPRSLERDEHGAPVVRGQVLAVTPTAQALNDARKAGFDVVDREGDADAGATDVVVLIAPPGLTAREAIRRLRKLDPAGACDYNHLYLPAAETPSARTANPVPLSEAAPATGVRIGLIDTGVDAGHAVFLGAHIEQQGFANGAPAKPAAHGTQVASLLIGAAPSFHSAAPGAQMFVADIYGSDPAGGAADALVRALFWLAGRKVNVINISLVGPPNAALSAGVKALAARGILIVAAVGNDGPAAPPSYPASYPSVVAVTGVDARGAVLIEAGRAEHLDFAAPAADLAAASILGGFTSVRGTSFAAPLVAGLLARLAAKAEDPSRSPLDALASQARRGRGYGRGLVAMDLRTPPIAVHARADVAQ